MVDNLSYGYGGTNQVQTISDAAPDMTPNKFYPAGNNFAYTYDPNGNLWTDASKGITNISYNLLDLPETVTANGGTATFTYDASGTKLRKVSTISGVNTDYIDGIQYEAGAISFIQTEEGRALNSSGAYHYEYSLTDHLGNSRLTFDTYSGTANTVQQDDYLPFGYEISRGKVTSPKNEYLYNRKELQEDLVLEDYGARYYDPVLVRWTSVDPKAEKSRRFSVYNYVEDNPIRNIDPDGMEAKDDYKLLKNGDIKLVKITGDKTDRIVQTKSNGDVKYDKKGEAKTAIGGIEKGILKDGINFKTNNNVINVGGAGQASVAGVEDFALKLSNYVDREIGGYELSNKGETDISHIYFGHYDQNTPTLTQGGFSLNRAGRPDLIGTTDAKIDFHTHLSRFGDNDRLVPSGSRDEGGGDMETKANTIKYYPSMKFVIITNPSQYDTKATEIAY